MLQTVIVLGVLLSGCAATALRPSPHVRIWHDDRWSNGEVIVPASPEVVYAKLASLERWPEIFTYLARVEILAEPGTIRTKSNGGQLRVLELSRDPARRSIRIEEIGGRAPASAVIEVHAAGPAHARVRAALRARLSRALAWMIGSGRIRQRCAAELLEELTMVRDYFWRRAISSQIRDHQLTSR